jgi:hypothetical protein
VLACVVAALSAPLAASARTVHDAVLAVPLALEVDPSVGAYGGPYTAASGAVVRVLTSPLYPKDDAVNQRWADFLDSLVHGSELASLTLVLAPPGQVQQTCGLGAYACYNLPTSTIVASNERVGDGPTPESVVAHEYGHHIAAQRSNTPWRAENWGTKRWATAMGVCPKVRAGTLHPGDERVYYLFNPGEAFAESYRVLNLTKEGATSIGWDIVDRSFYPDATALSLLEQDIMTPWTGPTLTHLHGSFGNGVARTFGVTTTLDGSFVAHLHSPTKARMRLALYSGSTLIERGATISFEICGQRSLTLKVERLSGRGSFTVDVSKP